MKTVTFTEFRKHASGLLSDVERGEVVVVLRHGRPVAEISPHRMEETKDPSWRRPGLRLSMRGASLARAILEEREAS
jgi:prevent-host-death family protein